MSCLLHGKISHTHVDFTDPKNYPPYIQLSGELFGPSDKGKKTILTNFIAFSV